MTAEPTIKLGYIIIRSKKIEEWSRFAGEGLGLHVDRIEGGGLALRLDDYKRRLIILPGEEEDVESLGWEAGSEAEVDQIATNLESLGLPYQPGLADEAENRAVRRLIRFEGAKGLKMEVYCGAERTNDPLEMKSSGFVTGDCGVGHVAIVTKQPESLKKLFVKVLGAKLSDTIFDKIQGVPLDFTFLHLNPRHHSVAIGATRGLKLDPIRTRIQHFSIQAESFADVTAAYSRVKALGFPIAMGIGQHPNDHQTSFYVISPSGFEFEVGWNPLRIDDEAAWEPQHYEGVSSWGHKPENVPLVIRLATVAHALGSLFRKEKPSL